MVKQIKDIERGSSPDLFTTSKAWLNRVKGMIYCCGNFNKRPINSSEFCSNRKDFRELNCESLKLFRCHEITIKIIWNLAADFTANQIKESSKKELNLSH